MNQQRLNEWIKHPEKLNRDTLYELRTLLARYPYFQTVRLLYLKNLFLLHDITFGEELRRSAIYITDRKILFNLVEGDHYGVKALEKQVQQETAPGIDRTLSLIDAFLATLPEETNQDHTIPLEISTDYTSYLLKEDSFVENIDEQPSLQGQDLIDSFINKTEEGTVDFVVKEEEISSPTSEQDETEESVDEILDDESYFTETLAKIYVKQQRYSKALEIIRKLNLNYPKKNAYFADQIRFLEKLIINANQNNENVLIIHWIDCCCSTFDVLCSFDSKLKGWWLGFQLCFI